MSNTSTGLLLLILVLLTAGSAFFSSSETGMMSLNRYRLKHLSKKGNRSARRAEQLLARPDRLLGTILVGNNVVNILAASIATVVATRIWGDAGIAISTAAVTIVVLIFGEITPKTFAAIRPEAIAFRVTFILATLQRVLSPIVWLCNTISNGILRLFGITLQSAQAAQLSSDELRTVVNEASLGITPRRQNMLLSILDMEQMTVNDIMVPRNDAYGLDLDDDMSVIRDQLQTSHHTRLPVFRGDINNVTGLVHMRSIARLLSSNELTKENLIDSCKEPYFIPENTPLHTQLLNFQKHKRRIGFVVDEYGDVIGLITLEDILEEIVGEFTTDLLPANHDIHPQADGTYVIDGSVALRDINRQLLWQLPEDGPKTLNGLITEWLENIPDNSVGLSLGDYRMEILQTKDNMIKSVRIWQVGSQPTASKEAE